jgi:hypothetical protein
MNTEVTLETKYKENSNDKCGKNQRKVERKAVTDGKMLNSLYVPFIG